MTPNLQRGFMTDAAMKTSLEIAEEITQDCACKFCCCTLDGVEAGQKKLALEFRQLLTEPITSGEMLVAFAKRCAEILNINGPEISV